MTKIDLYKVVNKETTIYKLAKQQNKRWHAVAFEILKLAIKELRK